MKKPLQEAQLVEMLSLAQQAEEWRQILKAAGPNEEAAFWAWVEKSPLHLREVFLADTLDSALDHMDPERKIDVDALIAKAKAASNVTPLERPGFRSRSLVQGTRVRWWGAIAASVLIFVIAGFAVWRFHAAGTYATAVGEQRMLELEDGSVVFLNTTSRIRTDFSSTARDIYLTEGQALFHVKHDPSRPFRVHADTTIIQALGTKFDVRRYDDRTSVAVVEGVVGVIPERASRALSNTVEQQPLTKIVAGEGATISMAGKISTSAAIDPIVVTAWRRQQLVFRDDSLEFIASEFNRYNSVLRLRVEASAGTKQFNGVFNAHSPESFVRFLGEEEDLEFERRGDEVIIRERADVGGAAILP